MFLSIVDRLLSFLLNTSVTPLKDLRNLNGTLNINLILRRNVSKISSSILGKVFTKNLITF